MTPAVKNSQRTRRSDAQSRAFSSQLRTNRHEPLDDEPSSRKQEGRASVHNLPPARDSRFSMPSSGVPCRPRQRPLPLAQRPLPNLAQLGRALSFASSLAVRRRQGILGRRVCPKLALLAFSAIRPWKYLHRLPQDSFSRPVPWWMVGVFPTLAQTPQHLLALATRHHGGRDYCRNWEYCLPRNLERLNFGQPDFLL